MQTMTLGSDAQTGINKAYISLRVVAPARRTSARRNEQQKLPAAV